MTLELLHTRDVCDTALPSLRMSFAIIAGHRTCHIFARRLYITKGPTRRKYATPSPLSPKPPIYGQPVAKTHPHLIAPHELTPGITKNEYDDRRARLMDGLPDGSLVVWSTP